MVGAHTACAMILIAGFRVRVPRDDGGVKVGFESCRIICCIVRYLTSNVVGLFLFLIF